MDKKNICPTKPYIRLFSQHFGKLRTGTEMPFSKKLNLMQKGTLKPPIAGTNFSKVRKSNTFGMNTVPSVGKKL
jgi:hypothetical protein